MTYRHWWLFVVGCLSLFVMPVACRRVVAEPTPAVECSCDALRACEERVRILRGQSWEEYAR